jgi:hypothetical protein
MLVFELESYYRNYTMILLMNSNKIDNVCVLGSCLDAAHTNCQVMSCFYARSSGAWPAEIVGLQKQC